MEDEVFECPNCKAKFIRDNHYKTIIDFQNFSLFSNEEIINMCMKCHHIEYKESE